ncbi:MAG: DUF4864 domain-containing protein [Actinomycetota bacterium]|nr:DUF4864 domain-containing protein [Actinomycetota bacterium]
MARCTMQRCAVAAIVVITVGCGSDPAPETVTSPTTSTTPAASPTTSTVTPTSPTPAPDADDDADGAVCDAEQTAELAAVVEAQIAALSRGDFAAAHDLATDAFRSQVSLEQFTMIITGSYGFLLAGPDIVVTSCRGDATTVELQVNMYAREPVVMGYLLRRHDAGWAIDAAAVIGSVEGIRA